MEQVKPIAIKAIYLIVVLVAVNWLYNLLQFDSDIERFCPQYYQLDSAAVADIIYFGDCSDVYCRGNCSTDTTIAEHLDHLLPNKQVYGLSDNGYTPEIYLRLLKRVLERSEERKTVIITLNLRAFADHVIMDPYYVPALERQLALTDPWPNLFNRSKLAFNLIRKRTWAEYYETTYEAREELSFRIGDSIMNTNDWLRLLINDSVQSSFIHDFAFQMKKPQLERLSAIDEILSLCLDHGWKPILHFVPFNQQGLEQSSNVLLSDVAMRNRTFLLEHFERLDGQLIDHSLILKTGDYLGSLSNSHYTSEAKKELAVKLANELL